VRHPRFEQLPTQFRDELIAKRILHAAEACDEGIETLGQRDIVLKCVDPGSIDRPTEEPRCGGKQMSALTLDDLEQRDQAGGVDRRCHRPIPCWRATA